MRVWSRKASWGKAVLMVIQVENRLHLKTTVQCLARTRVVTIGRLQCSAWHALEWSQLGTVQGRKASLGSLAVQCLARTRASTVLITVCKGVNVSAVQVKCSD